MSLPVCPPGKVISSAVRRSPWSVARWSKVRSGRRSDQPRQGVHQPLPLAEPEQQLGPLLGAGGVVLAAARRPPLGGMGQVPAVLLLPVGRHELAGARAADDRRVGKDAVAPGVVVVIVAVDDPGDGAAGQRLRRRAQVARRVGGQGGVEEGGLAAEVDDAAVADGRAAVGGDGRPDALGEGLDPKVLGLWHGHCATSVSTTGEGETNTYMQNSTDGGGCQEMNQRRGAEEKKSRGSRGWHG